MKDLKTIGNRLKIYLDYKQIGVNELGRLADTSGGQISHIIHGRNYGTDKILDILSCQPELNSKWLLFGQGPMTKDQTIDQDEQNIQPTNIANYTLENLQDELMVLQNKHILLLKDYHNMLKQHTHS